MKFVTKSILKEIYKKRDAWCHKGNFGKLLAISGSKIYTGSPVFVGLSAYKAGCDMVYLTGPERAMNVAASYSPLLMTRPLDGMYFGRDHISKIINIINEIKPTAIVIGPGLSKLPEIKSAIIELVEKINLPMVIDADAIRALSDVKEKLVNKKVVITPHTDEFKEFTGLNISRDLKERIKKVREEAGKIKNVILLKGHVDVIASEKEVALNKTGSPYMTKGGLGDTLTGICGALLARGIEPFKAACAAAYINGLAGQIAAKEYKEGLTPLELIENISKVISV